MAEPKTITPTHKVLLLVGALPILAASIWSTQSSSALVKPRFEQQDVKPVDSPQKPVTVRSPDSERETPSITTHRHQVESGDSLSSIFSKAGAPFSDLQKIMRADVEYLALETLRPGTTLELTFDKQGRFTRLTLEIDAARTVSFTKTSEGTFEYHKAEADTHWVSEVLKGSIDGSFYASARRAGLSDSQIASVRQVLEHKLDFRRELRAGDKFAVIVGHEMSHDQSTGNTRIEAATIERNTQTHTAFRFEDGNYYDKNGRSVLPAFRRWPTPTSYRVSSNFDRNREHPVTGRRSPHNGVDLATPSGTTIMSTGDGIVKRVGNHPYAGKYVDIDHGNAYKTRYLHLNKILVKKGDKVERGHKIALSGNTGRSTGPHLHFELHIDGRPVDPLKAEIPTAADVASADVKRFEEQADQKLAVMGNAASRSDLMLAGIKASFE